ncbi:amino acid--tRNA ligase-related protein [Alkanindiges illinoisensis]|uniref:amino acid--tRNA ligase-related protein n=1 Tax=Alkanindiges illinoisensis TaxID=197183 RepID=UPI00047DEDD1|nr:amino acid--tRNA ligase-related protein [Alkanindiges illinoisensis]
MNTSTSQQSDRLQAIRARAILYQHIREFFSQRQVLEVETPILQATAHSDNRAMIVQQHITEAHSSNLQISLQSSPASAMQQLLACGCGAIYQICKVFQHTNNVHEHKRKHSSEFSMLAWYTPNATFTQLMQDSQDLLAHVFGYRIDFEVISYQHAFMRRLDINPHQAEVKQLKELARRVGLNVNYGEDRMAWLEVLFCHFIEPTLGYNQPVFLTDFPVEKAVTAQTKINEDGFAVAVNFVLYIDGLKLVSGQVTQAEQVIENQQPMLKHGRIFLGLDRLLMLLMDKHRIDQVTSFSSPMY